MPRHSSTETPRFQSTRPLRGATRPVAAGGRRAGYFNPRAPCGARRKFASAAHWSRVISIHAPLAGRDIPACLADARHLPISIHAPLAGRDWQCCRQVAGPLVFQSTRPLRGATPHSCRHTFATMIFQSTRPLRGATRYFSISFATSVYFNPRAPCGARRPGRGCRPPAFPISIHAPLAGRDFSRRSALRRRRQFQSTRPLRGATIPGQCPHHRRRISIHAPLAGRDSPCAWL